MKKISLFATDFDGTLLRNDSSFSSRDLQSLETLRENGCAVVLATGRSPLSLQKSLGKRNLPVDWYVLSSGAGIMNSSGDIVLSRTLAAADTAAIHKAFLDIGVTDTSIQGAFPEAHILHWMEGSHCLDFRKRLAYYRSSSVIIDSPEMPSTEVIGFLRPDEADSAVSELQKRIGNKYSVIRATSPIDHNTVWIEVFAGGVDKASACESIRQDLEIPMELTAAVGNDWNDIQMLRWAEAAFVSQNAPDAMLNEFRVVPSNQHHAVATAAKIWRDEIL